jgi:hypothetical protein
VERALVVAIFNVGSCAGIEKDLEDFLVGVV